MLGFATKKPDDRLDYDVDFSRWLDEDDALTDASAGPADGIVVEAVQIFGQIAKIWLSGGDAGKSYRVSVTATTTEGRVKEECFVVRVTGC